MAVDLARYVVSLEAQTTQYVQKLDQANKKLDRFHKDQERALGAIKKAFLSLGVTLASALSVAAILNFTKASIQMADQLGETARAAGVSAETLQRLRFAFDQLGGIASGETDQGLQRFNRTLGLAINGSRQAQQQFRLLGVAFKDSLGRGRGTDSALEATLKALGEIENDAQRAAVAASLFGREMGPKLAAALKGGSQALDEARRQVTGIISDESVRKAEELDDVFKRMAATLSGPLKEAAIGVAFEFSKIFGQVEDAPQDVLNKKIAETQRRIEDLNKSIEANRRTRAGFFGWLDPGPLDRSLATLQANLTQAQMNLAVFQAAASASGKTVEKELIEPIKDGLAEISSAAFKLPADFKKFDFTGALNAVQFEEIRDVIVKMPDDLKKLSPEFNNAVAANARYIEALKETDDKQKQLAESMGRAFEDAFTGWILGAERSFSDLLKRMAAEFATSALFKGLASLFPGGSFLSNFFGGGRAEGGPVSAGKGYMVGERGPEWFMPGVSGSIIPGGAGGISVNPVYNIDARGASVELVQRLPAILRANNQQLKAEISDARRRGRPI